MKIYRKIVIDIATGATLEEDSCEYSGPVALCKGGSSGSNEVKETAQEVALSKVTQAEWNRFKNTYQPLMNKEASYYEGLGKNEKNRIAGAVNAGATKTYDNASANTQQAEINRGVGPSGMAVALGDVNRDKAASTGNAIVKGEANVDRTKVAGLQNTVNMMRGDAGTAVTGMGSIATDAVNKANSDAYYRQKSRNDNFELGASVAGAGLAAVNNYKKPTSKPNMNNVGADIYNQPSDEFAIG